jgi:hypothetical protein
MIFEQLQRFRQELYEETGKARDALFDLMDAVLVSESITSFVSLSQSPVFRRKWPSVYAALKDSRLCANKVMKRVLGQVKAEGQPLLVGDKTLWSRPDAPTLRERTHGQPGEAGKSLGHSYSTIAWIPEGPGSWAVPLRHERISSFESALDRAAFQLKQVTKLMDERPLAALDREYGNGRFLALTDSIEVDLLLRLRTNACVFAAPPAYSGRGAPRKHGAKFKLNDSSTWLTPSETIEVDDPKYGQVQLTRWSDLHFKQSPKRATVYTQVMSEQVSSRRREPETL